MKSGVVLRGSGGNGGWLSRQVERKGGTRRKKGVKGVEGGCDGPIGEKGRGRGAADAINDNKKGAPASSHLRPTLHIYTISKNSAANAI